VIADANSSKDELILGLDLGVASIGWALIAPHNTKRPIVAMGVRRFEAGVDGGAAKIEEGKATSRAKVRRDKRQVRRQGFRRARRMANLFYLLQQNGMLPAGPSKKPEERHAILQRMDAELGKKFADHCNAHVVPYHLRSAATDSSLDLSLLEIGRALYHLAQRRGFKTNLKAANDEEDGVVKQGIGQLYQEIEEANCQTLGQYFATLDPEQLRIRGRWTSRQMFLDEFELIWKTQAGSHPELTDKLKEKVHHVIFFQRPLRSQKHLIGHCELETAKRRAPAASLEFQEFRYLQKLNDLTYWDEGCQPQQLSDQQREKLITELEANGDLTFKGIRKLLKLKTSKQNPSLHIFNFEEGGDSRIPGNRTASKLFAILGTQWTSMQPVERGGLVDSILSFQSAPALRKHLVSKWGTSDENAQRIVDCRFEDGFGSLSRKAISRLLPHMRQGLNYYQAEIAEYPEARKMDAIYDRLPPVNVVFPSLRNPAVLRVLTELKKVVNALIRKYGQPTKIRIELARDLAKSNRQKQAIFKRNRENEKSRERAIKGLLADMGEKYVTPGNVLKVRLAEECNWDCPYTGRRMEMATLVGENPQFDIEHIQPFSRSLNNSFLNKTLCYHEENRSRKKNRTPWEAYGETPSWDDMLMRVKNFIGPARNKKLELFSAHAIEEGFAQRLLSDTQFVTKTAADYVGLLFGGRQDSDGKLRVEARTGMLVSYLRDVWQVNRILHGGNQKNRADHRHHAVDALVVACSTNGTVKQLSDAAKRAEELGIRHKFDDVELPWKNFIKDATTAVNEIIVSTRVHRKLNGQIHDESNFSPPSVDPESKKTYHRIRKPLSSLSANEVEAIIDPAIRDAVKSQLIRIGGAPAQAFKDEANLPYIRGRNGRFVPIKKVRIRSRILPKLVLGKGDSRRYVAPGNNHHAEFLLKFDNHKESAVWDFTVVSLYDSMLRSKKGQQGSCEVIQKDHGPGAKFMFSLVPGEHLEVEIEPGQRQVVRCLSFSDGDLELILPEDARPSTERKASRIRIRSAKRLTEIQPRKVLVDPIGQVFPAND